MVRLSSTRGRTLRALAATAVLAAAACTSDATSPLVRAPQSDALASHNAGHLHTGKYRVSGASNATGRSGSARLAARAFRGADGVTRLLVTTGSLDDPGHAPGTLAKVQLKVSGPEGNRLFTRNYQRPSSDNGSHEFLLEGLPRGSRIDIQANVRGIDGNRTDVVNVTATVVAPPAFLVSIDPPAQVVAGVPTVVTGTVTETGGDAGGFTSCVLYVDGVEVDRIDNIWVDAGDVVTCAFTHTFGQGAHNVEVRLLGGGDGGLIGPGPSDGGLVNAVNPNPNPTWTLSVEDRTVWHQDLYYETASGPDGWTRFHDQDTGVSPRTQSLALVASLARATAFPLSTVDLEVWSDAGPWHAATWSGLNAAAPDASGQSCVNQLIPEQGAHFYLCSTGMGATGSTAFGYTRFAGTVTYHSYVFGREWNEFTGQEIAVWSWNNESEDYTGGGQRRPMGSQVSVRLNVTDGVGSIPVNATAPLVSYDYTTVVTPYACRNEIVPWLPSGFKTVCEGTNQRTYGSMGNAAG